MYEFKPDLRASNITSLVRNYIRNVVSQKIIVRAQQIMVTITKKYRGSTTNSINDPNSIALYRFDSYNYRIKPANDLYLQTFRENVKYRPHKTYLFRRDAPWWFEYRGIKSNVVRVRKTTDAFIGNNAPLGHYDRFFFNKLYDRLVYEFSISNE